MNTQFYYLRTTGSRDFVSGKHVPHQLGQNGVNSLVAQVLSGTFSSDNWEDLKAIERTILSVALANEVPVIITDSPIYGKKYLAVAHTNK
jgi:hypothetical protein